MWNVESMRAQLGTARKRVMFTNPYQMSGRKIIELGRQRLQVGSHRLSKEQEVAASTKSIPASWNLV